MYVLNTNIIRITKKLFLSIHLLVVDAIYTCQLEMGFVHCMSSIKADGATIIALLNTYSDV